MRVGAAQVSPVFMAVGGVGLLVQNGGRLSWIVPARVVALVAAAIGASGDVGRDLALELAKPAEWLAAALASLSGCAAPLNGKQSRLAPSLTIYERRRLLSLKRRQSVIVRG